MNMKLSTNRCSVLAVLMILLLFPPLAALNGQDNAGPEEKARVLEKVNQYERMLKDYTQEWKDEYFKPFRENLRKLSRFPQSEEERAREVILKKALSGAAVYCDKMQHSAFHFFCKEHITELADYSNLEKWVKGYRNNLLSDLQFRPTRHTYLYQYQLIKKEIKVTESRTLLKINGVKKNEENAKLRTYGLKYEKLIFGPFALLAKFWQKHFFYKIITEDTLWGEPVLVVEALPFKRFKQNQYYGRLWISKKDHSVLKIQWEPKSTGLGRVIRNKDGSILLKPEITFYTEFKIKKRGIRFPSRYFLEEMYVNSKGKKTLRNRQDVRLDDYMFFVVASEVIEEQPSAPIK